MKRKVTKMAAIVSGIVGIAAGASGASAATLPSWHFVKSPVQFTQATAVVATGKTTGFAFESNTLGNSILLERTGATSWKQVTSPVKRLEDVIEAEATSPTNVYAFTLLPSSGSRILRFNGTKWTVLKTFTGTIGSATVLSSDDIWVFGRSAGAPLGVYHYNGKTWTKVATSLGDGYAISDKSVYAISGGTTVAHYNGTKWSAANLAALLPKKTKSADPTLNSVLAESASNIYAIDGGGNAEIAGDPVVILHYNGSKWSKVAEYAGGVSTPPGADGKGGLWDGALGNAGSAVLLHYTDGKLAVIASPKYDGHWTQVNFLSRIPGTAEELAGGQLLENEAMADAILQYS
jgi:hypothetical protein